MSGVVICNGKFPAGSVVRLVRVVDERVLRAEGGDEVDVRVVAADGSLGFDQGIEVGGRFFAVGYALGAPLEVRCVGEDADAVDPSALQAPVQREEGAVGTSNTPAVKSAPLPSAADLGVGLAPGAAAAVGQVAPVASKGDEASLGPVPTTQEVVTGDMLFVDVEEGGEIDADVWESTGLVTAPTIDADGTTSGGGVALYRYVGTGAMMLPLDGWERYIGPPVPPAAEVDPSVNPVPVEGGEPEAVLTEGEAFPKVLEQAVILGVTGAASMTLVELRQSIIDKNATPVA